MSDTTTLPLSTDTLNKFHELTAQFNAVATRYIAVLPSTMVPYGNTDDSEFIQLLINGILTTMDKVTAELPPLTSAAIEAIRRSFTRAGLPVEEASVMYTSPSVEPWLNGERWGHGMKLTFDPKIQANNPDTVATIQGVEVCLPHAFDPNLAEKMRSLIAKAVGGLSKRDKNELKGRSDAVKEVIADHYAGEGAKLVRPEIRRNTMRSRLRNIQEFTMEDIREVVADQRYYAQEMRRRRAALSVASAELVRATFDMQALYHSAAHELGIEGVEFTEFMHLTSDKSLMDSRCLADGKQSIYARGVLQEIVEKFPTASEHLDVLRKKVAGEDDGKAQEWLLKPRGVKPGEGRHVSPNSEVNAIEQSTRWFNL